MTPVTNTSYVSTKDLLLPDFQLERLGRLVDCYVKEADEKSIWILQAPVKPVEPSSPDDRPVSPRILRVVHVELSILPKGAEIMADIERTAKLIANYPLEEKELHSFHRRIEEIKGVLNTTLLALSGQILGFKIAQASPDYLIDKMYKDFCEDKFNNLLNTAMFTQELENFETAPEEEKIPRPEAATSAQNENID
jgi:hypothetical protein